MKKRILDYVRRVDLLLSDDSENIEDLIREHLDQIAFFQHERLVHLIVTMTVAILLMMSIGIAVLAEYPLFFLISGMLLVLLCPYLAHYYLLENNVQKLYGQYDRMLKKRKAMRTEEDSADDD